MPAIKPATVLAPPPRSGRFASPSLPAWAETMIGPLVLVLVWAFVHATGLVTGKLLPSPVRTIEAVAAGLASGDLAFDLGQTVLRTLQAFVLAIGFGLPAGIVIGSSRRVYRSIEFLIDFFRSMPATALFPLFMIVLGLGDVSKIAVAAFSAFLIILFNVAYGVMNARPTRRLAARVMGASRLRVFRDVTLYESLPQTFVGVRTAVSLALVVIIVAEMFIGSDSGLGKRIIDAQITFDMPALYGTILLTGALGYALNLLLLTLERRLVHWAGR
ncbi:ABC transporter permease [uncultured Methylobacterium sp.]|uniref:ABC transporter permease n=1 Tax=uncultured Methylobacterium sp. TaxID=157278 RepID=UPI0035CA9187